MNRLGCMGLCFSEVIDPSALRISSYSKSPLSTDGEWVPEVIDDTLFLHVSDGDDLFVGRFVDVSDHRTKEVSTTMYDINKLRENLQKGSEALYFARCKDNSDTWLPLIEKAYAKAHGDFGSLTGGNTRYVSTSPHPVKIAQLTSSV